MSYFARTGRIYCDHAATTPPRSEIEEEARAISDDSSGRDGKGSDGKSSDRKSWGNASSAHLEGRRARDVLDACRDSIRRDLSAREFDVVFTAGATESNNAAVLGRVLATETGKPLVLASVIEHPSVLETRALVERLGGEIETLMVDASGCLDLDRLTPALDRRPAIVAVHMVNNEVGSVQPIERLGVETRRRGLVLHCDLVQALGKIPLTLDASPIDLASISGHKLGGDGGVGALLVRRGTELQSLVRGGSQQYGWRAGTEAPRLAASLAAAVRVSVRGMEASNEKLRRVSMQVTAALATRFPHLRWNSSDDVCAPGFLHVSHPGVEGNSLVKMLDHLGVAASTGSACATADGRLSHVLEAMGRSPREVRGSLRLSFGALNSEAEIPVLIERLTEAIERLEAVSPWT